MTSLTQSREYTDRLKKLESIWWKKLIPVQAPYRWHLRQMKLGFVLDIGCGIGRSLSHVSGFGVGIDHNAESIKSVRGLGFRGFTPEDFLASEWSQGKHFDSILLSHVLEHMDRSSAINVLKSYLPYLKEGGQVVILCPQEAGYRSDKSHVTFLEQTNLGMLVEAAGLLPVKSYSFPFPRWVGRYFKYNEFVNISRAAGSNY